MMRRERRGVGCLVVCRRLGAFERQPAGPTFCAQVCSRRWDPVNKQCRYSATCLPCDDVVPEGDPLRVLPW